MGDESKIIFVIKTMFGLVLNFTFLAALILIVYNTTLWAYQQGRALSRDLTADGVEADVEITLPEGATVNQVADLLAQEEVIPNALLFTLESRLKGTDAPFRAGTYRVNGAMNSNELNAALRAVTGHENEIKITITEGFSLKNIADYLEGEGIVTAAEFLEACATQQFEYDFVKNLPQRENRLEGYLFPDTYYISETATPREIIYKMLDRFEEICGQDILARANHLELPLDDVIKIASMIEKEIRVSEERPKASSVIYNRMELGMPLQMCSTVLYVLNIRRDHLTESDLAVESPYNTYIHTGLPQGPICNPGKACIEAALYPEETDLLYFVVKDEERGEHFFTDNYDAFVEAKILYNQKY
jgi:UPF0755 protein